MAFGFLSIFLAIFGSLMIVFGPPALGLLCIIGALFFAWIPHERRSNGKDET